MNVPLCSAKCMFFIDYFSIFRSYRLIFYCTYFIKIYTWRSQSEHGDIASVELEWTSLQGGVTSNMVEATSLS